MVDRLKDLEKINTSITPLEKEGEAIYCFNYTQEEAKEFNKTCKRVKMKQRQLMTLPFCRQRAMVFVRIGLY